MTGEEMKAIRESMGLQMVDLGLALGHQGTDKTIRKCMFRYENGTRDIPDYLADLLRWYVKHGIPDNVEPNFPRVCDGMLIHGEVDAVKAYTRLGSPVRANWLRRWYYDGALGLHQFALRKPVGEFNPTQAVDAEESVSEAAIAADDPIIKKDGGHTRGTLLGARLSVFHGAPELAAWLRG